MCLHGIFESPSFSRCHLSVHWLSLFNQSNMKPGDLVSLEMFILRGFWEVTVRLSRASLQTEALSASFSPLRGFSVTEEDVVLVKDAKPKKCRKQCESGLCLFSTCFDWIHSQLVLVVFPSQSSINFLSCVASELWAFPAFEISCSSNPLIRVSRWDYHRGQPQFLPRTITGIVEPAVFDFHNIIQVV